MERLGNRDECSRCKAGRPLMGKAIGDGWIAAVVKNRVERLCLICQTAVAEQGINPREFLNKIEHSDHTNYARR